MTNEYIEKLKFFVGKDVEVFTPEKIYYRGKCIAIGFQHLNLILQTKKGRMVIKNISTISELKSGGSDEKIRTDKGK